MSIYGAIMATAFISLLNLLHIIKIWQSKLDLLSVLAPNNLLQPLLLILNSPIFVFGF